MQRERREQQGRHIRQERARGEDSESEERSGTHTSIHSHHQLLYVITSHPSHSSLHSSCLSLICHPRHTHPLSPLTPTPPRLTFSFFPPTSPGCTSRWCCFFCCLIFLACFLDFVLSRVVGFHFLFAFLRMLDGFVDDLDCIFIVASWLADVTCWSLMGVRCAELAQV